MYALQSLRAYPTWNLARTYFVAAAAAADSHTNRRPYDVRTSQWFDAMLSVWLAALSLIWVMVFLTIYCVQTQKSQQT